jgi:hypothetical protein
MTDADRDQVRRFNEELEALCVRYGASLYPHDDGTAFLMREPEPRNRLPVLSIVDAPRASRDEP